MEVAISMDEGGGCEELLALWEGCEGEGGGAEVGVSLAFLLLMGQKQPAQRTFFVEAL